MPGRNGRGPIGQGAMPGRGMGWCGGTNVRVDMPPRGPGLGLGRGGGRGESWRHRHCFPATGLTGWQRVRIGWPGSGVGFETVLSKERELAVLKQQADNIENTLGKLKSRIQSNHPLIAIVDNDRCTGCEICINACPDKAISVNGVAVVDSGLCIGCGACIPECPNEALSLGRPSAAVAGGAAV
jgi:ferredoxin